MNNNVTVKEEDERNDIETYKRIAKRFVKLIVTIVAIKLIRRLIVGSDEATEAISMIVNSGTPFEIISPLALLSLSFGVMVFIIGFMIKGSSILDSRVFNGLVVICIIESIFMFFFPEITLAVLKAIMQIEQ